MAHGGWRQSTVIGLGTVPLGPDTRKANGNAWSRWLGGHLSPRPRHFRHAVNGQGCPSVSVPRGHIPQASSPRAMASMRSDSLTRNSLMPVMTVTPSAVAAKAARTGYFVDFFFSIARRALWWHMDCPFSALNLTRRSANRLAPFLARVFHDQIRRPYPAMSRKCHFGWGFGLTSRHQNVRILHHEGCANRECGRAWVTRHSHILPGQFGLAGQGDDAAFVGIFPPSALPRTHAASRSVWSRVGSPSMTTVLARRVSNPQAEPADFTCADGHGPTR